MSSMKERRQRNTHTHTARERKREVEGTSKNAQFTTGKFKESVYIDEKDDRASREIKIERERKIGRNIEAEGESARSMKKKNEKGTTEWEYTWRLPTFTENRTNNI